MLNIFTIGHVTTITQDKCDLFHTEKILKNKKQLEVFFRICVSIKMSVCEGMNE